MKRMRWTSTTMLGIALLSLTLLSATLLNAKLSVADEGHDHGGHNHKGHDHGSADAEQPTGPHGGTVHAAGRSYCEVCFAPKSIRVYLYDSKGQPISAEKTRGVVTMNVDGNPKKYRYDLYPESTQKGRPSSLFLAINLSKIPDDAMLASFGIQGLPGAGRRLSRFEQRNKMTSSPEQRAIAKQGICPVSGEKLGSMGGSIKVSVKGRDVYVCCKGCVNRLKRDPDKYLARLSQNKTTPVKATKADAVAIARQKFCPVMDEPLNSMGVPWKVHVAGRDVFVCCKGCIKKLQRNPKKYIAMLPAPAVTRATKADSFAIARQKLCPVMDEPLGSMGVPWKVYAKGRPVFVCCKGCIKKIHQNPDLYLAKIAKQSNAGSSSRNRRRRR